MILNLLKDGTKIYITVLKQSGIIVGAIIRQGKILYEVSYCENGTYRVINLAPYEFTVGKDEDKQQIGFRNEAKNSK